MEQVIAGRYRLGALLGAGGMARVVAAHDLRLDRPVAIKMAPASGIDRVGRERFVREARSLAGFSHPNAVAVFDAGEADGYLYLVMELVDGPSVAAGLPSTARLTSTRHSPSPRLCWLRWARPTPRGSSTATSSRATSSSALAGR